MGVELANQMKSGDFNALDFGGDWAQITSRLIEPVMETSMLSGLYSTLESMRSSYGDDDKQSALSLMGRETAQSYLNSLVPTVVGQISRTAYKSDKQVSGDTDWEYFKNSMKSKTGLCISTVSRRAGRFIPAVFMPTLVRVGSMAGLKPVSTCPREKEPGRPSG